MEEVTDEVESVVVLDGGGGGGAVSFDDGGGLPGEAIDVGHRSHDCIYVLLLWWRFGFEWCGVLRCRRLQIHGYRGLYVIHRDACQDTDDDFSSERITHMRLLEKLGQQVWLYGQKNNVGCADGFDIIAHLDVYE